MLRLDACLGAFKEEALKAFVFEDPDHLTSVTQNAPRYKRMSNVKMPNAKLSGGAADRLSAGLGRTRRRAEAEQVSNKHVCVDNVAIGFVST